METTMELLLHADPFGMTIGRLGNVETRDEADARVEELRKDLEQSPWYEDVESDLELVDALSHVTVSDAVRTQCLAELANAKKCNWRIID